MFNPFKLNSIRRHFYINPVRKFLFNCSPWRRRQSSREQFALQLKRVTSFEDSNLYFEQIQNDHQTRRQTESSLSHSRTPFTVPGWCFVCKTDVDFYVDYSFASSVEGKLVPNWREQLVCPYCALCNRMRAALHIFEQELLPDFSASIYITEQTTIFYKTLRGRFSDVQGSEYLGANIPFGDSDSRGIRNEDITGLSFPAEEFDFVLSFDVLEHVPDYVQGLTELFRVLKPGGSFLFSVPFSMREPYTITRAVVNKDGTINHILPPEYHGDPIRSDGCLCFYNFGWDILEILKTIGFESAEVLFYWSIAHGHIGKGDQYIFAARKPEHRPAELKPEIN